MTTDYIAASLMPSLPTEAKDLLEDPITLTELHLALGNAKSGKALGQDGLTTQYYKTLLPSLGNHLVTLFNGLSTGKQLHRSTLQAQISVIPKEGKEARDNTTKVYLFITYSQHHQNAMRIHWNRCRGGV